MGYRILARGYRVKKTFFSRAQDFTRLVWPPVPGRPGLSFNVNPTSPLGLGGLAVGICFYAVFAVLGEVYLSPYPLSMGLGRSRPAPS